MGLSPLQKCTAALHILAYGSSADSVDDYVRIGESTTLKCLDRFVIGVCTLFGAQYIRSPNNEDIAHLLQINTARGFPGSNNDINVLNKSDVFNDVVNGKAPAV
ncbi:unnamed protein product [Lathyrus sativus]|nr:unnamed protein product [Lathyrus sativus]